jgi:CBS-domain-containing membrane protein
MMSRDMLTVQPDDRIGYAARLMRDWDCGALPVIDQNGSLIGMLTDRDITMRLVANDADTRRTTVGECMTDGAYACQADDSIRECMRQMARHQIRRLPVVNNYGQVIGIISQSDLARHAGVYPGQGARRSMADVLCAISEPSRYARR